MSMDLEVWSPRPFKLPHQLPKTGFWNLEVDEWAYEGNGWHILVLAGETEPDGHILERLPDAKYVAYVNLEPIGADSDGYSLLEEVIRTLTKENDGLWINLSGIANSHDEGVF